MSPKENKISYKNLAKALGLGISLILIALAINIVLSLIKNKELERNGEH